MNILIVGCGKVGQKLAQMLCYENEHNITVIDSRAKAVSALTDQFDIMGVVGNGASVDTLTEAGIEDADILIAVTGSDELNLLTCLIAKKAGNCRTIARVRKPEYSKELHFFKEDLGLAMIINPEQAAAAEMARVLRFPSAIRIDTFSKGRVEILKFRIPPECPLDNIKVCDIMSKLNCDILVCGVQRGDDAFIPRGDFILHGGDLVSIVCSIENSFEFFKKMGIHTNRVRDTIIVGGGDTGYYLAKLLLQSGTKVKIIEQNEERCQELCQLLPKADIIYGDGTDSNLLLEEGIEDASSFVSLTNIDEENIMISLFAKSKADVKVITKINRISYDEVIKTLNLDSVIYPKNITAEYIVRFVRALKNSEGSDIETIHFILDGMAEALEFKIKDSSPVVGVTLEELRLKPNTLVACIYRNKTIIIPRGKDIIKTGDSVIVVTTNTGFKGITDILA